MKNVWILNHYALEPGGAGGTRHYSLARHLAAAGWKSTVIAASVELNTGRQRLGEGEVKRLENFDGVPFLWLRTPTYRGNGIGRIRNMLTYSARVLLPSSLAGLPRPDVVVGSSVHPFAAWSGALLASRYRVPFVFEVRDLWPQTLIDLGRIAPDGLAAKLLQRLEKWLYRRADRIVVLLPKAAEYIVPLGVDPAKIVWVPNGVDLAGYPKPQPLGEKEPFTLMYFGAHGQANALDCVLEAMKHLKTIPGMERVQLRLIGDGPLKPELRQLAAKLGLENVSFEPPVPKTEIPLLAAQADAFVFNLVDAPVFRYGISSNKLFDFLAGGRPIVFCCDAANNPVTDAGAGVVAPPGDPVALAEAIASLVRLPVEERNAMGSRGHEYVVRNHCFSSLARTLGSCLDSLAAARP